MGRRSTHYWGLWGLSSVGLAQNRRPKAKLPRLAPGKDAYWAVCHLMVPDIVFNIKLILHHMLMIFAKLSLVGR